MDKQIFLQTMKKYDYIMFDTNGLIDDDGVMRFLELVEREAAEQSVYTDAPKPFVNHCNPVNGVHAPFCNGDHSARG